MRKTITKRVFGIFGIFALAILFFACPDELVQKQEGKAMVSFSVRDARTVLPQVSLTDVASYKLLGGINNAAETVLVESFTGTGTSVSLDPGTWNFTLNAYNNTGGHILQGTVANKQINVTGTNQVSFSLSGVNSGTGTIEITLNFPEYDGITKIVAKNGTDSEDFPITDTDSGIFVYAKDDIAAGDYLINFELYRGDILRARVSELVVVRGNLSSGKTITLIEDNLKPLLTVGFVIDLAGLSEWELTEQTVQIPDGYYKYFTVTETYATYRWYLDGTEVETSSSYYFYKPVGVYQLVVVATNSDGESRSGRCRITVVPSLTNIWTDGNITDANGEIWYSIWVSEGTTYNIWWNDRKQGNETKSGDVAVSARYADSSGWIFGGTDTTVDDGWDTVQSFTADQYGRVYIRVIPYNRRGSNTGTYGIVYSSTSSTRPADSYTVTFDANSGNGTIPARLVNSGYSTTLPDGSGLSRSGYAFGGWRADSLWGTDYDAGSSYTPTGDITFYARWYTIYTVTFNINGGSGATPPARTGSTASSIILPDGSGFSRDGYAFGGWNTNSYGTGTNYDAGSSYTPTGNITLYARWYNYTVTFNLNNGSGTTPAAQTVSPGSGVTLSDGSEFSRGSYTFGGWNTDSSGTGTNYAPGSAYIPTDSITLYARWYSTVTFDLNSGTGTTPAAQTVNPGSDITLPDGSGLSRVGYIFGGWNTNTSGTGTNYAPDSSYAPTGDITLYAKWYLPLSADVWTNGNLSSASGEDWYLLPVSAGTTYYIWWNDSEQGSETKSGDVVVGARYLGSSDWIFGGTNDDVDSGWNTPQSFTPTQDGTVEIRVIPYDRGGSYTGTYGIVYSASTTRPAL